MLSNTQIKAFEDELGRLYISRHYLNEAKDTEQVRIALARDEAQFAGIVWSLARIGYAVVDLHVVPITMGKE